MLNLEDINIKCKEVTICIEIFYWIKLMDSDKRFFDSILNRFCFEFNVKLDLISKQETIVGFINILMLNIPHSWNMMITDNNSLFKGIIY